MRHVWTWLLFLPGVSASAQEPSMHFEPKAPLLDEVVRIGVSGLAPGKPAVVRARMEALGKAWASHAEFVADAAGKIDLAKQAPRKGTYDGVEPMGLFWAMEPDKAMESDKANAKPAPPKITDPRLTHFEVELDGRVVAKAELARYLAKPGVRITDVRENGLVGKLFEPEAKGKHAALIILSGSGGGMNEGEAALLASRGYITFALAYFDPRGLPGLPKELVKIPLEYLKTGIDWLAARDSVDAQRLGVLGTSKGGELALLLGATFPQIKLVVANVPSHVTWSGIGGSFGDPGWTYQGKPLPYVKTRPGPAFFAQLAAKKPLRLVDLYAAGLEDKDAEQKAIIAVEKINGPVLLVTGKDDQMWPSSQMADKVVARLRAHKHAHPFEHLSYEGAGHAVVSGYMPMKDTVIAGNLALGGSVTANARAFKDYRPKVLEFLKRNLAQRGS